MRESSLADARSILHALLGFECGARTKPFLGDEATAAEHRDLVAALPTQAPFLGMLAWGEVFPLGGRPEFFNYSFPIIAITE